MCCVATFFALLVVPCVLLRSWTDSDHFLRADIIIITLGPKDDYNESIRICILNR